jgi:hypothetical protein
MSVLLVDTNVVSILFNQCHSLRQACIEAVAGDQLVLSFMSRAELLLWPAANNWEKPGAQLWSSTWLCTSRYIRMSARARSGRAWWIDAAVPPADPDSGCMDRFRGLSVGLSVGDNRFPGLCGCR